MSTEIVWKKKLFDLMMEMHQKYFTNTPITLHVSPHHSPCLRFHSHFTPSVFHSRLKTRLFTNPFPCSPFLISFTDCGPDFLGTSWCLFQFLLSYFFNFGLRRTEQSTDLHQCH